MNLPWTKWAPIAEAVGAAPRRAGVHEARTPTGVVYVGSAGHRRNGLAARIAAYARGKSPDSGLTGHASKASLADPEFCELTRTAAEAGSPWTLPQIAVEALDHLHVTLRSAPTDDFKQDERRLVEFHGRSQLWNVR